MMGLAEIKKANRNPRKYAMDQMSDGQERRNNARPSAYWSEKPAFKRLVSLTNKRLAKRGK